MPDHICCILGPKIHIISVAHSHYCCACMFAGVTKYVWHGGAVSACTKWHGVHTSLMHGALGFFLVKAYIMIILSLCLLGQAGLTVGVGVGVQLEATHR
jgi:hypothetical protein